MQTILQKLDKTGIHDLLELSAADGFPYPLDEKSAEVYCQGRDTVSEGVQTYGVYAEDQLVSVITATFCRVFPCKDSPTGRIVHISGAYTLPAYRHRGYASCLLSMIETQAAEFGADYICCDSTADGLYLSFGMEPTDESETRMWKRIWCQVS